MSCATLHHVIRWNVRFLLINNLPPYDMLVAHFQAQKGTTMSSPSKPTSEPTAVLGATLIDGTGRDPVSNAAILIEGGRIRAVGPRGTVEVPQGAIVIEAEGMALLPGFIDCHVHLGFQSGFNMLRRLMTPPSLSLLYAVPHCRVTLEGGITVVLHR